MICALTGIMKKHFYIVLVAVIAVLSNLSVVAAVTTTATPHKYAATPGHAFPVEYTVSWEDGDGAFVVLPPEIPPLEWGMAAVINMHTTERETRFIVEYRSDTAGTYTVPGLTLRLATDLDPTATDIAKLDEAAPTRVIETDPVQVVFRKPRIALWIGGIMMALLVVVGLVAFRLRTRGSAPSQDAGVSPLEQAQELLHQARRSRLDGDFYAFYRALHSALTCIATHSPEPYTALREKIKRAIDDTGYRGMRPSDDVLEGDFRDVERIVAQEQQRAAKET